MKQAIKLFTAFGVFALSSVHAETFVLVGNGTQINSYDVTLTNPSPTDYSSVPAGAKIMGLATEYTATGPVIFGASNGLNEIYSFSGGSAQPAFSVPAPIGLAMDSSGDVYTTENNGASVEEFSSSGTALRAFPTGSNAKVQSLAVDAAGDVFYADAHSDTVFEYTAGGVAKTVGTTTGAANFYGMAIDNSGDLFVSYWSAALGGNGGILEINPTGGISTFYTASASVLPTGLAVDPGTDNLYMTYVTSTNATSGGLDVFNATGGTLVQNTNPIALTASNALNSPFAVTVVTPEPSSVLMLTSGLLSLALFRRRRSA